MNLPDAACCSACGRALGRQLTAAKSERRCSRCKGELVALQGEHGVLLDCASCGGQFVEHALLRDLIERRERAGRLLNGRGQRSRLTLGRVDYAPCPECGQLMNRKNFGGASGVIVDVCHQHGAWFDAGELGAVLAYVESGGALEPKSGPAQAGQAFRPTLGLGALTRPERVTHDIFDFADAAAELLEFVSELLAPSRRKPPSK